MSVRRVLCSAAMCLALLMPPAARAGVTSITQETFTGTSTTANAFIFGHSASTAVNPCLTAGSSATASTSVPACASSAIDATGSGALRLTSNQTNQSGFVINTSANSAIAGLQILFDYFSYGGSAAGGGGGSADGLSFFFIDGSRSPTAAGGYGGSLGYAVHTPDAGLVGGFAGIGLDEFGNFSNPTEGRTLGPGQVANTIALRGSESSNYAYVTGYGYTGTSASSLPFALSSPSSAARPTPVHLRITLSSASILTVEMDNTTVTCPCTYTRYIGPVNLNTVSGQAAFPATFKYGFAASTGTQTNYHEIRNFSATTAPPDITISKTHSGIFAKNGTGTWAVDTQVTSLGGAASDPIVVTDALPTGFSTNGTPGGTGWNCSASTATVVSCTYTPSGSVPPGTVLPTITIPVTNPKGIGTYTNTASVTTTQIAGISATSSSDTVTTSNAVPILELFKRIVQVVTNYSVSGSTVTKLGTAMTIVPTPDPTAAALTAMQGTTTYSRGFYPGDIITYAVYFRNTGGLAANGAGSTTTGPAFSDIIPSNFNLTSLVTSGSPHGVALGFTCCANPTSTIVAAQSLTGSTLKYAMPSPLPVPSTTGASAPIQGSFSYEVTVP